jgi:hypothetical protein
VIDSNAKLPASVLEGNIKLFGSFDECISVKSNGERKCIGQYCLADILEDRRPFEDGGVGLNLKTL